jgi:RNA polymerase-binding transcription factor DksA
MAPPTSQSDACDRTREPGRRIGVEPDPVVLPEQVAAILSAAREQALCDLAELTGSYDDLVSAAQLSNADDEHDSEGATIASERSQLDALVRAAQERLAEIDAAAARLADGRYGICESCGRPIPAARLEARPVARACIACAARSA